MTSNLEPWTAHSERPIQERHLLWVTMSMNTSCMGRDLEDWRRLSWTESPPWSFRALFIRKYNYSQLENSTPSWWRVLPRKQTYRSEEKPEESRRVHTAQSMTWAGPGTGHLLFPREKFSSEENNPMTLPEEFWVLWNLKAKHFGGSVSLPQRYQNVQEKECKLRTDPVCLKWEEKLYGKNSSNQEPLQILCHPEN